MAPASYLVGSRLGASHGKFKIQVFRTARSSPRLAGRGCGDERYRRDGPFRLLLLHRQGHRLRLRHRDPWGPNSRQMQAWLFHAGGLELLNEFYAKFNHRQSAGRQHRRPDGRLVPQGDQVRGRSAGPEDAHRRPRRQRAAEDGRGPAAARRAATSIRRWNAASSTRSSSSAPTTTRSSASPRSRRYYYYPRLLGRLRRARASSSIWRSGTACRRSIRSVLKTCAAAAGHDMQAKHDALNPQCAEEADLGGAQLRPLPNDILKASYKHHQGSLRRDVGRQSELQEDLRPSLGFPARIRGAMDDLGLCSIRAVGDCACSSAAAGRPDHGSAGRTSCSGLT